MDDLQWKTLLKWDDLRGAIIFGNTHIYMIRNPCNVVFLNQYIVVDDFIPPWHKMIS